MLLSSVTVVHSQLAGKMKFICLLSLTLLYSVHGVHSYQQLRYALFTAGPLTGGFDSSGAVPAIELAEEMINADSSILPGYSLTHTGVYNTMVSNKVTSWH